MVNQRVPKRARLSRRVGSGVSDIGHVRKIGLQLCRTQHVLPVATRQDKIVNLAGIRRAEDAGNIADRKAARGQVVPVALVRTTSVTETGGRVRRGPPRKKKKNKGGLS